MLEGKKADFFRCHCAQIQIMMNENTVKWGDKDQKWLLEFIILH